MDIDAVAAEERSVAMPECAEMQDTSAFIGAPRLMRRIVMAPAIVYQGTRPV